LGISYLFGFCVFGFSSTIRKFYSALIRNSITSGYIWCFPFAELTGLENNIYAQVAMVMLIGLLGKNAVLIVEFAIQRHAAENLF
jgi:multidrug efflux pump subunit AcrB